MKKIVKLFAVALLCVLMSAACEKTKSGDNAFEPLHTGYREILAYSGTDYNEPIKKIDSLQNQIRDYLSRFPESKKRTEAERILAEIKNMQQEIQREQFDFSELEKRFNPNPTPSRADAEINEIKHFVRTYPHSPKRDRLTDKLDELNFLKFQTDTAAALDSIEGINRVVRISNNYLAQIRKKGLQDQVKDKITKTEGQRRTVYQNEFNLQANEMLKRMRWRAIEVAKKSHPFSKIESVKENVISGDLSTAVPGSVTAVREYTVRMVGAIIGHNRYRVTVQAKGIISGTLLNGVSADITETVKVGDFRVN